MSDDHDWIAERRPRAPAPLLRRLTERDVADARDDPGAPHGSDADERSAPEERVRRLARAGAGLLEKVVGAPADDRETAYLLLEADALLTYACEAAAESGDPEAELRSVLRALAPTAREDDAGSV